MNLVVRDVGGLLRLASLRVYYVVLPDSRDAMAVTDVNEAVPKFMGNIKPVLNCDNRNKLRAVGIILVMFC